MEVATLNATARPKTGTREARALRKSGRLPAVIYGHDQPPEAVTLSQHDVVVALGHGARMLKLAIGSKSEQYLIKEVQYDHLGLEPIHLDLARVSLDERVHIQVGIEPRGTPKEGILEQYLAEIEVECLVTAIPDTLHPLVMELAVGDVLLVKDLKLPPDVSALNDPEDRVLTVRALKEELEEEAPTEAAEEGAAEEPERIGRVRKDEDEGEGS